MEDIQHLAGVQSAGLVMRDTGSKGWVDGVKVQGYVERAGQVAGPESLKISHLEYFDAEAFGLPPLVRVERADANLHQPSSQPGFHNAGKWAGMREMVAIQFVVQIGMRVDMQNCQVGVAQAVSAQDGVGDGVIAAQGEYPKPFPQQAGNGLFDLGKSVQRVG